MTRRAEDSGGWRICRRRPAARAYDEDDYGRGAALFNYSHSEEAHGIEVELRDKISEFEEAGEVLATTRSEVRSWCCRAVDLGGRAS